jgi:hypothetical protein
MPAEAEFEARTLGKIQNSASGRGSAMNLDDMDGICERCRFWERHVDEKLGDYGFCRRHAPRAVAISKAAEFEARWPITHEGEWCGEHQYLCGSASVAADPVENSNHR